MPSCSAWAQLISSGSTWPTWDAASSANPKTGTGTCGSPGNLGIPANGGRPPGRRPSSFSRSTPTGRTSGNWPPADALDEGRVGGQQSGEPLAGEGVGEKHVTGLGGLGVVDARALGQPADL